MSHIQKLFIYLIQRHSILGIAYTYVVRVSVFEIFEIVNISV